MKKKDVVKTYYFYKLYYFFEIINKITKLIQIEESRKYNNYLTFIIQFQRIK